MLISICIANFNCGLFIKEAIDSVIAQNYSNWELIIVDDGSTDNSLQVISQFLTNKKITLYKNAKNQGVGFSKRKCIDNSNGEIIGFLDADDQLEAPALSEMMQEHKRNPNASLIFSNFRVFDESMNYLYENHYEECEDSLFLMKGLTVNHFSTFKKNKYIKTEGINVNFIRSVDRDLYLKLEEVGTVKHLNSNLYKYRYRENSLSNNMNSYRAEYWAWQARFEACTRRQICAEDIFSVVMKERDNAYFGHLISPELKEFKIGLFLLSFLRRIKQFFQ